MRPVTAGRKEHTLPLFACGRWAVPITDLILDVPEVCFQVRVKHAEWVVRVGPGTPLPFERLLVCGFIDGCVCERRWWSATGYESSSGRVKAGRAWSVRFRSRRRSFDGSLFLVLRFSSPTLSDLIFRHLAQTGFDCVRQTDVCSHSTFQKSWLCHVTSAVIVLSGNTPLSYSELEDSRYSFTGVSGVWIRQTSSRFGRMSSADLTREWLRNVLRPYPSRDLILPEVLEILKQRRTLSVKTDAFSKFPPDSDLSTLLLADLRAAFDSGQTALLILVHGTLPINYRGATYQIPLHLWIPHSYPRDPPMMFVVPTKEIGVRKGREVEPGGRVREEIANEWWRSWQVRSSPCPRGTY